MKFKPGKNVGYTDPSNIEPLGVCDISGQVFKRKDLLKQMEWRGNSLQWTGMWVGRPYLDSPNQQNRPPVVKADPVPVKNPRLPKGTVSTWSSGSGGVFGSLPYPNFGAWGSIYNGKLSDTPTNVEAALREVDFNSP